MMQRLEGTIIPAITYYGGNVDFLKRIMMSNDHDVGDYAP